MSTHQWDEAQALRLVAEVGGRAHMEETLALVHLSAALHLTSGGFLDGASSSINARVEVKDVSRLGGRLTECSDSHRAGIAMRFT